MKQLFFLILLGCISLKGLCQYQPDKVSTRAKKWYLEAQKKALMQLGNGRAKAFTLLKKAVAKDPGYLDAYALMGSLYEKDRKYTKALKNFDAANRIDSAYLLPAYYSYAKAAAGTGNFARALQLIHTYLKKQQLSEQGKQEALEWEKHYAFGLKSARQHLPFHPVNLGDSINTSDPEYFPNLTIDGKTLIFTRNLNSRNEDFFVSHLLPDSLWSKANPLTAITFGENKAGVNSQYNEGAETISQDGKLLIYTICDRPDGMGSCDIYYSVHNGSDWSRSRNIGSPISSRYWDTQPSLSPDERDLYFVSNRPGGLGGSDIYVSHLQSNGTWGKPQNLGDSINTPGNESSPFIHADNKTLYFASDGRPGVGGVDLYYVRKKVDGTWGTPHNMGYPINTIDHDGSIFVTADGKTAYFASDRKDSRGLLDLYKFSLYPAAQPVMTLYVHGIVYNKKNKKRIIARLDLMDLSTGKTLTTLTTDKNGVYLITLPVGKDYAFNVSKPGYLFYSGHFSLKKTGEKWRPFTVNIGLQPIEAHAHITLNNIFFDLDKYTLKPASYPELNKVVTLMKNNPDLVIQINGYTDSTGNAAHNLTLSGQRAQAVVDYLKSKGIATGRLQAKGFGANHPVASNATEAGRAKNRRTELEIVKNGKK